MPAGWSPPRITDGLTRRELIDRLKADVARAFEPIRPHLEQLVRTGKVLEFQTLWINQTLGVLVPAPHVAEVRGILEAMPQLHGVGEGGQIVREVG